MRQRVQIRDAKGNWDRFVPLPLATHTVLRRFWQVHRNPVLLFPSRLGGLAKAVTATTPMDPGGVQTTLHKVVQTCGLEKISRPTRFDTIPSSKICRILEASVLTRFDSRRFCRHSPELPFLHLIEEGQ